jgi:streptogramin lyase
MTAMQRIESTDRPSRRMLGGNRFRVAVIAITIAGAAIGVAAVLGRGTGRKATTDNVVATLRVAGRPNGLAAGSDALWVVLNDPAKQRTSRIERLDLVTGAVQKTVTMTGSGSFSMRVGRSLWVGGNADWLDTKPGTFRELDWKTGAVRDILAFNRPVFGGAYGAGSLWFVVGRAPATLVRVDPRTRYAIGKPIRLDRNRVIGLAFGEGSVWATGFEDGKLIRVNPKTGRVDAVKVGDDPVGVVVAGGSVWVANRGSGTVGRIDAKTMREDGHSIHVGALPTWVAAFAGSVWVSSQADGTVTRIDERTGKTIGSPSRIAAPSPNDAAAHVMSVAGGSLWVVSATERSISRIDPNP